jgi:hypothetical protein
MKSNSKFLIIATFLLGFFYRTLVGLQGIDDLDAGFSCTYFQNFFTHPESFNANHLYYLMGFTGGLWTRLFPETGILGLRFLDNLLITLAVYLMYLIFRTKLRVRYQVAAIFLSYLFPYIIVLYHYNTFSYLSISASAYFFFRARTTHHSWFYLLSGLAVGIGIFSRIVNVTLFSLLLIPLISYYYTRDRRQLFVSFSLFLSGILVGVICVITLMLSFHHLDYFIASIQSAFMTLHNPHQSHTTSNIFFVYFRDIIDILINIAGVIAILYVYACPHIKSAVFSRLFRVMAVIGLSILSITTATHLITLTLCLIPILSALVIFRHESETVVTILFYSVALFSVPLGSDIGISGIFHWQAGLLIFPAAYSLQKLLFASPLFMDKYRVRQFSHTAYFVIIAAAIYRMCYKANGEDYPRTYDRYMIESGTLNVYTDKERAAKFQTAISAVRTHSRSSYLIIANQMSELYFGMRKAPFLDNTCIENFADSSLPQCMSERTAILHAYPTIVFVSQPDYSKNILIVRTCLMNYIRENHYHRVVNNKYVQLYER